MIFSYRYVLWLISIDDGVKFGLRQHLWLIFDPLVLQVLEIRPEVVARALQKTLVDEDHILVVGRIDRLFQVYDIGLLDQRAGGQGADQIGLRLSGQIVVERLQCGIEKLPFGLAGAASLRRATRSPSARA